MELAAKLKPRPTTRLSPILLDCSLDRKNKLLSQWTVEQLQLEPYQYILEIGYDNGSTIYETAKKLKIGFIAGIDESANAFKQSYKKNKQFIENQLMQLHIGSLESLAYPAHYFHTVYSLNIYKYWKAPQYQFMRLAPLLKNGGKLVTVFQQRSALTEKAQWMAAEKMMQEYEEAGFSDTSISFLETNRGNGISVIGHKP